jgi:hypothetical protein
LSNDSPTAAQTQVQVAIARGTTGNPQWAAGNTNTNGLMGVPVLVGQFYGRAYCAMALNLGGGTLMIGMFNLRY